MSPQGDYLDLGYSDREVLEPGAKYSAMMRFTRALHELTGNFIGIQLKDNTRVDYGKALYFENNAEYDSMIFANADGHLCMFGDNGAMFGYREGNTNKAMIQINEVPSSQGSQIFMLGQVSMQDKNIVSVPDIYATTNTRRYLHRGWSGSVEIHAPRITNMNAYLDSGWYSFGADCVGTPTTWGILLTIRAFSSDFCQIVHGTNNVFYIRWYVNGSYTAWKTW